MENDQEVFDIDQIQAMRMGVDYRHPISIREFTIMVRPVTIAETLEIARTVQERFKSLDLLGRNALSEHTFLAQETLTRAAKPSPQSKEESTISNYIMNLMTPDELSYLHKQYVEVIDKVNPSLEMLGNEAILELVEKVKKNPSAAIELSFSEAVSMVIFLATKEDSQTDK